MRQFIILICCLVPFLNAQAISDAKTRAIVSALKNNLSAAKTSEKKLAALEDFRTRLTKRIQELEPKTPQEKESYARLNEFQSAIFSIRMKAVSAKNCEENKKQIVSLYISEPEVADIKTLPKASKEILQEAMKVLDLICQ